MIQFEWDDEKNAINIKKHGVDFYEAVSVFLDKYALNIYDTDHSEDEDRFIIIGLSQNLRALVMCHCYRQNEEVIRIISARKATKNETKAYVKRGDNYEG